jgi:hypothetical protein
MFFYFKTLLNLISSLTFHNLSLSRLSPGAARRQPPPPRRGRPRPPRPPPASFSSSQLSRPYVVAAACLSPPTSRQLLAQIELPLPKSGSAWAPATAALHQVPRPSPTSSPVKSAQQVFPISPLLFPVSCAKPSLHVHPSLY